MERYSSTNRVKRACHEIGQQQRKLPAADAAATWPTSPTRQDDANDGLFSFPRSLINGRLDLMTTNVQFYTICSSSDTAPPSESGQGNQTVYTDS